MWQQWLPEIWTNFAEWWDALSAAAAVLLILLLIIWWRQQTRYWFRIAASTFLAALILCILSIYLFVVPPHSAGCLGTCAGRGGYPLPVALLNVDGTRSIAPVDFVLNLLLLWLLWLGASLLWAILAEAFAWWRRPLQGRILFVVLVAILPWALLPRVLGPPQPRPQGEELRLANNARRSAEFTYGITGLWVQRLALDDMQPVAPGTLETPPESLEGQGVTVVCLRGYTYFYLPWRRYRITLDASGTTALNLVELPLTGSCWADDAPS